MHVYTRVCSTLIIRRVRIARPPRVTCRHCALGMCTRMRSYRPAQDPFHDPSRGPFTRAGALFVVARALEETRAVEWLLLPALGKPRGHRSALLRLCLPVGLFSAFLNNTPIVAMLLPICEGWAARCNLSIKVLPYLRWPQLTMAMLTMATRTMAMLPIKVLLYLYYGYTSWLYSRRCCSCRCHSHRCSAVCARSSAHRPTSCSTRRYYLLLPRPCTSAYCLLPTAYCLLPAACCLLPTAYCQLPAQILADPDAPLQPLTMFSMSVVGLPAALAGTLYLALL